MVLGLRKLSSAVGVSRHQARIKLNDFVSIAESLRYLYFFVLCFCNQKQEKSKFTSECVHSRKERRRKEKSMRLRFIKNTHW